MSRTYRQYPVIRHHWKGDFYNDFQELWDHPDYNWKTGAERIEKFDVKSKDSKVWFKPNKTFKKMMSKKRKAEIKDAMRKGKEIPRHKKEDQWNWN